MKNWVCGGLLLLIGATTTISLGRTPTSPGKMVGDEVAQQLFGGALVACSSGPSGNSTWCTGCGTEISTVGTGTGQQTCTWNKCGNATGSSCLYPSYAGCDTIQPIQ